jgi:malate dehydrogenase (oxaloacetate-decarboxylating)(NADP+)
LDVGATTINEAMQLACVHALAKLAMTPPCDEDDVMALAYGDQTLRLGPDYLIPKPFDPRLIIELPLAVARAAMETGVASRPIQDFNAYHQQLNQHVVRSGMIMRPLIERAKEDPKRIIYAQGEDIRLLRAVQVAIDDGLVTQPILVGDPAQVTENLRELGLHIRIDRDFQLIDPLNNPYFKECWVEYHRLRERHGIDPSSARIRVNTRNTVLGALLLRLGYGDVLLCGIAGSYHRHLEHLTEVLGLAPGVKIPAAMNLLITPKGPLFICDTDVNPHPNVTEIADMTLMAAEAVRRFGMTPKVALLSHSNFGSHKADEARKMAEALRLIQQQAPELEAEGEMQADAALSETLRQRLFPNSRLRGAANLLIMPNLDAANIAFNLLKMITDSVAIGPILLGPGKPAHILTRASTVRRIVNMTAMAVVNAQMAERAEKFQWQRLV